MNHDDTTGEMTSGDDFWGGTPDWTDSPRRPRREKRSGDVTGAIKNLWASAMTAGADATREHGVLDAAAARPTDVSAVGPQMFDDLDDHYPDDSYAALGDAADVDVSDPDFFVAEDATHRSADPTSLPTGEVPVIDVFDDDLLAAVAPAAMTEREDRRRSGAIDPLLVRIGAVAIATTLLIPLAIGLTSGDDGDTVATATTDPAAAAPFFDPGPAAAPASAGDGVTTETSASLDPSTLPPAVPVNPTETDAPATSSNPSTNDTGTGRVVVESATSGSDDSGDSDNGGGISASDSMQDDAPADTADTDATVDGVDEAATADDGAERITGCAVDYTVVAGDFWLRLADAAGVPLAELLEANGATTDTPLYPGTDICLPAGSTTPAPPTATTQPASTTTEAPTTTAAPTTTEAPSTTAAPTTTAPTTTAAPDPAPNTDATPDEVKQIIRDVWPDELEERALEIAFRESRYVPTAKNFCCYGIFQIYWSVHRSWLADIGVTNDQQLFDPATNARAAYALYERAGGWGPWAQTAY